MPQGIVVQNTTARPLSGELSRALEALKEDVSRCGREAGVRVSVIQLLASRDSDVGLDELPGPTKSFRLAMTPRDVLEVANDADLREAIIYHEIAHAVLDTGKMKESLRLAAHVLNAATQAESLAKSDSRGAMIAALEREFGSVGGFSSELTKVLPSALAIAKSASGTRLITASPATLALYMEVNDAEYLKAKKEIEAVLAPPQIAEMNGFLRRLDNAVSSARYYETLMAEAKNNAPAPAPGSTDEEKYAALKRSVVPSQAKLGERISRLGLRLRQAEEYAADAYSQDHSSHKNALMEYLGRLAAAEPQEIEHMHGHPASALRAERLRYRQEHGRSPDSRYLDNYHKGLTGRVREERAGRQSEQQR